MPELIPPYWPDFGVTGWTVAVGIWILAVILIVLMGTPPKD